jgi:hypothetical protein
MAMLRADRQITLAYGEYIVRAHQAKICRLY